MSLRRAGRPGPTALLVLFLLLAGACHKEPARLAYDSIDGATTTVLAAVKAFNVLYQQGIATEADREKVKAAYETFQKVAAAASYVAETATTPDERAAAIRKTGEAASAAVGAIDALSAEVKTRAPAGGPK